MQMSCIGRCLLAISGVGPKGVRGRGNGHQSIVLMLLVVAGGDVATTAAAAAITTAAVAAVSRLTRGCMWKVYFCRWDAGRLRGSGQAILEIGSIQIQDIRNMET